MADLSTEFLGRSWPTPLVLASGIWGTTVSLLTRAARNGCGAVTAKSCGPVPRRGHVNPSCIDWGGGLINAIGLANPGARAEVELLVRAKEELAPLHVPLIASIFGGTEEEFADVARIIIAAQPDYLEVNISCPNVGSEFGEPFAGSPESAAAVTRAVRAELMGSDIPLIVKLAPNVPSIARIAHAVVEAGADALCAINTMPGLLIDVEVGQPLLANRSGGISGPVLKPIALKSVYDVRRGLPQIPMIGTGGVSTGIDALEMMMAGADVVGVGSAIYHRGVDAFSLILEEMDEWLNERGIRDLDEIRNRAHQPRTFDRTPSRPPIPAAH